MISDMARGDTEETVAAMLSLQTPDEIVGLGGYGLAYAVFCRESANLTTEEATLAEAKRLLPQFPEQLLRVQPKQGRLFTECPIWDVGADAGMSAPTVSDAPVLIMEGLLDAATDPAWVDLIVPDLGNAQVVEFPLTGHSVLSKSACAQSVMSSFLDAPAQPVDGACAAADSLTFVTG
jgi:hypothetical protein